MKIRQVFSIITVSFVLGLLSVPAPAANAKEKTFFVAVNGNDSWSGRLPEPNADRTDGPFASLAAACRGGSRTAPAQQGVKQPRKVIVQAGKYFFDEPLVLDADDAGLTMESAPGGEVCLYGGKKVTGWEKDGEKFYSVELPGVKNGKWDFRALIVNGRFCRRARLPEEGFFEHLSSFDVPWMSTTGGGWKRKPTSKELTTMKYRPEDIGPWLDVNNAEVTIYHMWDESMVGVKAIDTENHILTFSSRTGHPPGAFGVKKYVIWNVREGMVRPGQWYLDRTAGKLVYWPMPGEDMAKAEVFAPTIESIIRIRGTRQDPARDITIRNLTLSVTTTPLEAGGFGAGKFDGAVSIASGRNCRLIGLEIANVGGQGIKASGDDLKVEHCHVYNAGACGIRCRGGKAVVTDNHIHDIGLTYPSAIALQGGGKDCRINHNEIHDCPYTAINCGGERNRIEHNLIYRAMKELHDGGGIYCFAGKDLVLRGNFIRDIIDTGGYGASAYYLDERSENCHVEGNLSVNVVRPSHNHMAKGNTIRNNIFISDSELRLTFPKSSNYTFEHNVVRAGGQIVLDNPDGITTLRNNILFSAAGKIQFHRLKDYSRAGSYSFEANEKNLTVDPQITGFEKGRVKFADGSPVLKLGIKPVDVSTAGVRGEGK